MRQGYVLIDGVNDHKIIAQAVHFSKVNHSMTFMLHNTLVGLV
jgi:hypothetical protein